MLNAGTLAAAEILRAGTHRLADGVALYAGSGNNGGDAYIVAAQLARAGVRARVHASAPPRTDDAMRAAALAAPSLVSGPPTGHEALVVDGLLGTGHRGEFRSTLTPSVSQLALAHARGAMVVALDLPSGLDATTGAIAEGSVPAALTVAFGTVKRGLLIQRAHAGRIVLMDIGTGDFLDPDDGAWWLASVTRIADAMPATAWNAHKGTRGTLTLVGGGDGMAGAIVLSSRAALASGCGLLRTFASAASVGAVQSLVPQAIAGPWAALASGEPPGDGAPHGEHVRKPLGDAVAIGPGLGRDAAAAALLARALGADARVPLLLDADALTLLAREDDPAAAIRALGQRFTAVVLTPHPGEFARLTKRDTPEDWDDKAGALLGFAERSGAVVLLKGTPTLIADGAQTGVRADHADVDDHDSSRSWPFAPMVVTHGNAVLATGGSGDLLTGIIGALLAGGVPPADAAMLGATAHGLAAEIAAHEAGVVRGLTLDVILRCLPKAWRRMAHSAKLHGAASEFPSPVL